MPLLKKNNHEVKPIFIVGVPRCGSTLVEKIIASGKKYIPIGEEASVLNVFIESKIKNKQSLNSDIENLFMIFTRECKNHKNHKHCL